jgi:non-homologous end joining protein Ku
VFTEERPKSNVVDLTAALEASLAQAKNPARHPRPAARARR